MQKCQKTISIPWRLKNITLGTRWLPLSGLVTQKLYFLKNYDTKRPKFPSCRNRPICVKIESWKERGEKVETLWQRQMEQLSFPPILYQTEYSTNTPSSYSSIDATRKTCMLYLIRELEENNFNFPGGLPGCWDRSEFIKIQFFFLILYSKENTSTLKLEIVGRNSIWMGSVLVRKCKDPPGFIKSVQLVFWDPQIYMIFYICL